MNVLLSLLLLSQTPELIPGATFEKTYKPSGLMPEHQRVKVGTYGNADIVPVAAWEKLFAVEPATARACVTKPVAELKALLKKKGLPSTGTALPTAGCLDASAYFTVQARRLRVGNVDGFFYVTEHFIEPVLTSNGGLTAWFQGLSADGKTYVVATFHVKAAGLRDDEGELQQDTAAYLKQLQADAKQLGALTASDFTPSLDELAAALTATKW